jgi:hypothetical protein
MVYTPGVKTWCYICNKYLYDMDKHTKRKMHIRALKEHF